MKGVLSEIRLTSSFRLHPSSFYFQSVIRPLDPFGQERGVARVLDVVGDVREVCAARPKLCDLLERALKPEVRGVRTHAQAVEHERVQISKHVERVLRNLAQV